MKRLDDVLDTPEIRRRTQRVLALKDKARGAQKQLSEITADIGDELIAAKAALAKNSDKTAWLRWLKDHVQFERSTAENAMTLARLRKRFPNVWESFAAFPPSDLYLIAVLPDEILQNLTPKTQLPTAPGGPSKAIEDMSARELRRALELLRGRKPSKTPPAPAGTRQARLRAFLSHGQDFLAELKAINDGSGKLVSQDKRDVLDFVDDLREAALHLKAWVTPEKGKRLRRRAV